MSRPSPVPDFCDECGFVLRSSDSGHGACLYCRLPDLLDQQKWVALNTAATNVRSKLMPLCTCDACHTRDIAATVTRAIDIIHASGGQA
jgi:hypothetical protein